MKKTGKSILAGILLLFLFCSTAWAGPASDPNLIAAKEQELAQQTAQAAQAVPGAPEQHVGPGGAAADPQAPVQGVVSDTIVWSNGRQLDLTKPMLALTFDDGPQVQSGNRIMDVFAQYGQRCTFFLVGDRIASRADEVRRMVADGHEVADHSYSHAYFNKLSAEQIRSEVAKCNAAIAQTTGVAPAIMRLPGGNKTATVLANVNMPIILWNVDTEDWKVKDSARIISRVVGKVKDGDVVLMHELYGTTATAVETIVPTLVSQGFQLVTVSELAKFRGYELVPGQIYYSFPAK